MRARGPRTPSGSPPKACKRMHEYSRAHSPPTPTSPQQKVSRKYKSRRSRTPSLSSHSPSPMPVKRSHKHQRRSASSIRLTPSPSRNRRRSRRSSSREHHFEHVRAKIHEYKLTRAPDRFASSSSRLSGSDFSSVSRNSRSNSRDLPKAFLQRKVRCEHSSSPRRNKKVESSPVKNFKRHASPSPVLPSIQKFHESRSRSGSPYRFSPVLRRRRSRSRSRSGHANRPVVGGPQRVIGLFNLPWDIRERDVLELYHKYGPIEEVRVIRDCQTRESRGFAFVYFVHLCDATRALNGTYGMKIDDRLIKAEYAYGERIGDKYRPKSFVDIHRRDANVFPFHRGHRGFH